MPCECPSHHTHALLLKKSNLRECPTFDNSPPSRNKPTEEEKKKESLDWPKRYDFRYVTVSLFVSKMFGKSLLVSERGREEVK